MVAEEDGPLGAVWDRRSLLEDVDDREPVLHPQRHEEARHEREVEAHVTFVPVAEVGRRVLGPLIRLGKEHSSREGAVDVRAQLLQDGVRLGQVLAAGPLALEQVRHCVEAEAVDARGQPEIEDALDLAPDRRVRVVQVGLVRVEAVPVVGVRDGIPRPVRGLEVPEDDPRLRVAVRRIPPHVEITRRRSALGPPRTLEPGMLVGRVVRDELGDDPQAAAMRLDDEAPGVGERAVHGVDIGVVGNVVPVVPERRGVERQQPEGGDPEVLEVVELLDQPGKVADAVGVAVEEGADVKLVDDRVLVPERIRLQGGPRPRRRAPRRGRTSHHYS